MRPKRTGCDVRTGTQQLLRRKEVAKVLRLSLRQVSRLTKRGDLRVVRIGRAVRYDPEDVAAFVAQKKV